MLQIVDPTHSGDSALAVAVDVSLFSSLVLSTASAVQSLLSITWMKSFVFVHCVMILSITTLTLSPAVDFRRRLCHKSCMLGFIEVQLSPFSQQGHSSRWALSYLCTRRTRSVSTRHNLRNLFTGQSSILRRPS